MAGFPIAGPGDFIKITGLSVLSGPRDFINEAADPSQVLSFHINGMSDEDMLAGGKYMSEYPITSDGNTASNLLPGATRTHNLSNILEEIIEYWRLTEDYFAWNEILRKLNEGGGPRARFQQIKSDVRREEVRVATSMSNKMEGDYFAEPNVNTMVGTGATAVDPTSLFMVCNEYGGPNGMDDSLVDAADGRFPIGTGLPAGFTTIHGAAPATAKWMRCWQIPYLKTDVISMTTVNPSAHSVVDAFTRAISAVGFRKLIWRDGATINNAYNNPDYMVPVSILGESLIKRIAMTSQNHFNNSPKDPFFPASSFAGIPIVHASGMDAAAVYPTSGTVAPALGAGATENGATVANAGPRFPLVSRKAYVQKFHKDFYFHLWPAKQPDRQHDTTIIPVSSLHNRICVRRRALAMIYPVPAT